jgi:hypothetical protein
LVNRLWHHPPFQRRCVCLGAYEYVLVAELADSGIKKVLNRERAEVASVPAGIENWEATAEGRLLTRQAHLKWLVAEFEKHDLRLQKRVAGQFTELYWMVKSPVLKKLVHRFNRSWFQSVKLPGPAFGNILIFRKRFDARDVVLDSGKEVSLNLGPTGDN